MNISELKAYTAIKKGLSSLDVDLIESEYDKTIIQVIKESVAAVKSAKKRNMQDNTRNGILLDLQRCKKHSATDTQKAIAKAKAIVFNSECKNKIEYSI